MLRHLMKYTTKIYLISKDGLIFAIILPLVLGLVFLFAFEGLITDGSIEPAQVAIRYEGSSEDKEEVVEFLDSVGVEGSLEAEGLEAKEALGDEDYLIYYLGDDQVDPYLQEGKLNALVYIDRSGDDLEVSMMVPPNMANQITTYVAYSIFNSYNNTYNNVQNNLTLLEEQAHEGRDLSFLEDFDKREEEEVSLDDLVHKRSKAGVQSYSHYLLTTLGYICCYFFAVGLAIVQRNEGYHGPVERRLVVSPVPHSQRVFVSFICMTIPSLLVVYLLALVYWQRDVGLSTDYGKVILLLTLGTLVSILLGMALAANFKLSEDHVGALSMMIPLVGALCGGFMGQGSAAIKMWLADHAPIFNRINPVTLVADGLYQLTFYPSYDAFYQTIQVMVIYLLVLCLITLLGLRRVKE